MRIASILILFVLISCSTTKFKKYDDETSFNLNGKVKILEIKTVNSVIDDTIKTKWKFYFDKNNNMLKEYYSNENFSEETVFNYDREGLLKSSIIIIKQNSVSSSRKSEYEYDKNKNCIAQKFYGRDTLNSIKTSKYDNKNNVIEEAFNSMQNEKYSWRVTYVYDYKKRISLLKSYDADNKEKNSILEFHYDKKGFIININKINSKTKLNTYSSIDYDRFGHSISYLSLDEKKNVKINNVIKNEYDKKGNLVKRETFDNGKLIEKSIMDITYW